MKKALSLLLTVSAALSLAGCTGAASPETSVVCTGLNQLSLTGPGTGYRRAIIAAVQTDPGLGGSPVALNNSPVTVYVEDITNFDLVGVCQGSFADCSTDAAYDNTIEFETDENGIMDFFIRLSAPANPGFNADGSIILVFGSSPTTCTVGYDITTP